MEESLEELTLFQLLEFHAVDVQRLNLIVFIT